MKTRLIIHYTDGKTFIGDWDNIYRFDTLLNSKAISSLQIQTSNEITYTLSAKKKQKAIFWYRDFENEISILKRISKNIWIELKVNKSTEERSINVIDENIRMK